MSDILFASFNKKKERFSLPRDFFKSNEKKITDILQHFVLEKEDEEHVCVLGTGNLPSKVEMKLFDEGEWKSEATCLFCFHRIRCATRAFKHCDGYKPNTFFLSKLEELETFLKENGFQILYVVG